MLTIPTDPDLDSRLYRVARALGQTPEQCALAALRVWLADNEDAMESNRRQGGDGIARLPEGFYD